MDKRHYADFFTVPENYKANMTREAINETPETWLDFLPHKQYVEFLNTLIQVVNSGSKSIWLTGNYGTGKSNAALVTQKLFMDDEKRVKKWVNDYKDKIPDVTAFLNNLLACRSKGTLVVYDYNALGVGPNDDFIVRLERGIETALSEKGMIIPPTSNTDEIVNRLYREDQKFFETRNSIQGELAYLNRDIKNVNQLVTELQKTSSTPETLNLLLSDVQKVLHKDKIYLDTNVTAFKNWILAILSTNNLKRIIFIFDEFHPFIESNKENLKTFEEIAENPGLSHFYFIPVTHMKISSYFAEGSANAKKSNDRFYFRNLQMPNDTAFILAAHAMKPNPDPKIAEEWKKDKNTLWEVVRDIAEYHFKDEDVQKQSFYDILPIHPMTAFLLKSLSEMAHSNQRSIFEYLKGGADGHEFQDFIRTGGLDVASKQFLTVDYLWKYFIERNDLGHDKEIDAIRIEFERIKGREFQNKDDDDEDIRVLKAVLLFCLLARLTRDAGHERLKPTVQNVELAFKGDGMIADVRGIIKNLADKHCFSVVNGNIELFVTSVGGAELQAKIAEIENQFHDLLSVKTEEMLKTHTKSTISSFSAGRFDVRVSDIRHTTLTNITVAVRDKYSSGQNKDTGTVCLWFVVAKNKDEQFQIPDKIKGILTQLRDHRIMMFAFPHLTFCDSNQSLWSDYITQYAQYMLENDSTTKDQRKKAYERLEHEWFDKIKKPETQIKVYTAVNGQVIPNDTSWSIFKKLADDFVRRTLPCCVDYLTLQITAFQTSALKAWATAGIQFEAASGQYKQLVNNFKGQGISTNDSWFAQNTSHTFAQIRMLFDKRIANTVDKGTNLSIRDVYVELQRAPYGMKCNVLSAFSLGFALRHILDKGYQWDNLQRTGTLDVDTLAELIESVVKDDGQNKIKGEKYICRLSREEKAFVEKAPKMFGITSAVTDARIEDVLLWIQTHIERISERVPLWVLPEYIRSASEPSADIITNVLNSICLAGSTSSKSGKTEDRTNAVKDIGRFILENDDLIDTVAGYIKSDNFVTAFQMYVDKNALTLVTLAQSVGDVSHGYCQAVLDKTAETAGLLWNPADISAEIDETIQEYEIIKLLKPITGFTGFVPYKNVIETLKSAITVNNKLPKILITTAIPSLSVLLSSIASNGAVSDIKDGLEQNIDLIRALFFDTKRTKSIELLKQHLNGEAISDNDLLNVYNNLSGGFLRDEGTFLSDVHTRIENFAKESVAQNIKSEWNRLTGTNSPSVWAMSNGIPAQFTLNNAAEANDIIEAVEKPESFSSDRLTALLNVLSGLSPVTIAECQKQFLAETVPRRFAKFNISLSSLLDFLKGKYGKQPNIWPTKPDISEFIRAQYKGTFAPQVIEKIRRTPAEDLKDRLLQLTQDDPELGLLFWE
jgi:hypothetical protein